jgi:hypothetical protein
MQCVFIKCTANNMIAGLSNRTHIYAKEIATDACRVLKYLEPLDQ